jgi:hypothetical protein
MLFRMASSLSLTRMLSDVSGSRKSKMASKPEVEVKVLLIYNIPLFPTLDVLQEQFTELATCRYKTNVYGTAPTASQHTLLVSPTRAPKTLNPSQSWH